MSLDLYPEWNQPLMSQKKLGLVELEWVCPNCNNRSPGPEKKCRSCGKPQPPDVDFVQPVDRALITDAKVLAQADRAADIHCPFCNARNQAGAENCRNCGAPLTGGAQRKAGQVVGAYGNAPVAPIHCPACNAENPGDARRCSRCGAGLVPGSALKEQAGAVTPGAAAPGCSRTILIFALVIGVVLLIFLYLATRTEQTLGTVREVSWQRKVVVESLVPVRQEAWLTEIPAGVEVGQCRSEVLRVQDDPAPNAVEVCGTPYTIDQGTGYGQVVQECQYQIYADFCQYTVEEWKAVDSLISTGEGLIAESWPALTVTDKQRAGERSEQYTILFETDGATYEYVLRDPAQAALFIEGSRWGLEINTFGTLTDVMPIR